jgi:hypothetical protein
MMTVRVDHDLLAWVDGYAQARRVPRTAVVRWALREARGLAEAGVPDLGEGGERDGRSARVGRVRGAGSRASSSPGAPVASRPAAGAPAEVSRGELLRRRRDLLRTRDARAAERTGHREGCGCVHCDDVRSGRVES